MARLGIDFGTSNTAVAFCVDGAPRAVRIAPGHASVPTAVFFDAAGGETLFGTAANAALIDGCEGRYMRALKSVLGTPLMRKERRIGSERLTLIAVVAKFLARVRERAEAELGAPVTSVLSGRPVRFHSTDAARNAQAETDLREAYHQAGFRIVDFMFEPEAAALTASALAEGEIGLVVDIGGGTSDFSVFVRDSGRTRILASHGIRLGGTDVDRVLSLAHVMPLLGRGSQIRAEMGPGLHGVPAALFNDLATWQAIPFLYTPETRRLVARYQRLAVDPAPFDLLAQVLELELGHDIAFAVEAGKIAANAADAAIDLSVIAPGQRVALTTAMLHAALAPQMAEIAAAAREALAQAQVAPDRIGRLVFVGGSSLLGPLTRAMTALCPQAVAERANAFSAVADGLALAAA